MTTDNQFFGPEPFDAAALRTREEAGTDHPAPESARDRATNGHATETGRKRRNANGDTTEVGTKIESKSGSPILDPLDRDADVDMGDELPQESTINVGANVGVQIPSAKAADLTPDTAYLNIDHHVVDTLWRPNDPTVLVTRGETQCDLWKLSSGPSPDQTKLQDSNSGAYVTAVAWDGCGEKFAVASTRDTKGTITMYDAQGGVSDMFPDFPGAVTGLYWAKNARQLVILLSDDRSSQLAFLDGTQKSFVFSLSQRIESPIYDLAWARDNVIFACGDGVVYQFEVTQELRLVKEHKSTDKEVAWTFLRCTDSASGPVAVVANPSDTSLWIPTHDIWIDNSQQGSITGLGIRPQSPQSPASSITIVSYSTDGSVHMWNVDLELKEDKQVQKFLVGSGKPALAAGFSPDGYALGAVSQDQLYVWNAERDEKPTAVWQAPASEVKEEIDHATNGQNGHVSPAAGSLSWDPDGKKLAYSFGNKVKSLLSHIFIFFGPLTNSFLVGHCELVLEKQTRIRFPLGARSRTGLFPFPSIMA